MRHVRFTRWLCVFALMAVFAGCEKPTMDGVQSSPKEPAKPIDPPPIPDDAPEFSTTESGLKYRILREADGKKPNMRSIIVAHYRGWLDDGTEFDSSYKRGEPLERPLQGLIEGWIEGLQLAGAGSMIELSVPPELGYKSQAIGEIPANSQLHFVLELIEVK